MSEFKIIRRRRGELIHFGGTMLRTIDAAHDACANSRASFGFVCWVDGCACSDCGVDQEKDANGEGDGMLPPESETEAYAAEVARVAKKAKLPYVVTSCEEG